MKRLLPYWNVWRNTNRVRQTLFEVYRRRGWWWWKLWYPIRPVYRVLRTDECDIVFRRRLVKKLRVSFDSQSYTTDCSKSHTQSRHNCSFLIWRGSWVAPEGLQRERKEQHSPRSTLLNKKKKNSTYPNETHGDLLPLDFFIQIYGPGS